MHTSPPITRPAASFMPSPPPIEAVPPSELVSHYYETFEAFECQTNDQRSESYRIRYQIYCNELGYEEKSDFTDEQEKDILDDRSFHGLLRHKETQQFLGTVRVIRPRSDERLPHAPCIDLCPQLKDIIPLETTYEVSRISISKSFRRRLNDGTYGELVDARHEHFGRLIPYMPAGLMSLVLSMTAADQRSGKCTHYSAIMDPRLLTLLKRMGIVFTPVGGLIEHHGLRQPCYVDLSKLWDDIYRRRQDIWSLITRDGEYWPAPALSLVKV